MKKWYILLLLISLFSVEAYSQKTIRGVVKDSFGDPIMGATVMEKGTTNGVVTGMDGDFLLKVKNEKAVIQMAMIGLKKVEILVGNKTEFSVVLEEDVQNLEEVVVVAYGQQKKASVTGAISSVGSQDIKQGPSSSVTNTLTGRIPGLVTRQTSGRPGEDAAAMFIRGRATPNGTSPLIMVDGVERDFSQLDPDEIESVSVLKDASATAVYGVRGANGVILVTTKRGLEGKAKISFTGEFGITTTARLTKMVNSEQYALLKNEGLINEGKQPIYTERDFQLYRDHSSPFTHPDNDYLDQFIKPGGQQKYNANISGGNKFIKYFVSLGYFHQTGIFETDLDKIKKHPNLTRLFDAQPGLENSLFKPDYDPSFYYSRYNVRSNLDIQVTKDFKIGVDFGYRTGTKNRPYAENSGDRYYNNLNRTAANAFPLLNPNGTFAAAPNLVRANPMHINLYSGYKKETDVALEGTVSLNYDLNAITKGLGIGGKFSYNSYIDNSWMGLNTIEPVWQQNTNGSYTRLLAKQLPNLVSGASGANKRIYWEAFLNYKRTFADVHNVSGLLLTNYNSLQKPGSGAYGGIPHIYQGVVFRANYDFDSRYLLEVNMGYNGSNRFAAGQRYALFPSASVGWVPTSENFLKDNTKILSYLKLRASLGQVGNDNFGSSFSYYYDSTYDGGRDYNFGFLPTGAGGGLLEGMEGNPSVGWERATKFNVGFESRWLEGKLTLSGDYFMEDRRNILKTPNRTNIISGITSFAPSNLMEVKNQGMEVELGWSSSVNDFRYWIKGNVAFARNKIIEQNEQIRKYGYMERTGRSIGQNFGYIADGLYNSYEEIAAGPTQFGSLQPGDVRYRDINGDGVINDYDIAPYGYSSVPEVTGSIRVGFSYKNFDVNVMFQGATNSTITLNGEVAYEFFNLGSALADRHLDRWTPETQTSATYHRITDSSADSQNNFKSPSSYYAYDASYLRLKNAEIAYNFPKKWLNKTPISSLRLYVNGFNLITWDGLKVIDPEAPEGNRGSFYPQQRIFNGGVNIIF